ncbi:SulA-like leucine-rich domain-containing protein [Paraferrimonas haliotis]|uniref:Cell division inhibitor SulA n=1 Tax=Paraferrimonas haliotis TaxID=2013866 RepID=A0AA37TQH3_9GAMM|nr:SulA-like leucine-rich domain-containing protein [Paraferrimonas haliotis]GLS83505.1 cell division inhibitor SulA [Paraferrimonas haliotis]
MSNVLGQASRHPGLWQITSNEATVRQQPIINPVSVSQEGIAEFKQLAPSLANLSISGQWLVLVAPPSWQYKQMLLEAGVAMGNVLLVHPKDEVDALWAVEQALTCGTCSAVVAWTDALPSRDIKRLQLATRNASAPAFLMQAHQNVNTHLPDGQDKSVVMSHSTSKVSPLH